MSMFDHNPVMTTWRVDAIRLSNDNMEEVAEWCNGRIRGTKLPIEQRVVQFDNYEQHPEIGEQEVRVGDYLVIFHVGPAGKSKKVKQVWQNETFQIVFNRSGGPSS